MTQNANISVSLFLQFCKKNCMFFTFCVFCAFLHVFFIFVITFEPKKIQTRLAPQNDRLNLSFVKYIHVVGKTITRSGLKTSIFRLQILWNTLYYNLTSDHIPDWKLLGYAVEMHSNCVIFFAPLKSQYIKGKNLNSIMQYVEN